MENILRRKGFMYVTWADLVQVGVLIVAIIALFQNSKHKK